MEIKCVFVVIISLLIGYSNFLVAALPNTNGTIVYPIDCEYKVVKLPSNTSMIVEVDGINLTNTSFLVVQAHSQSRYILLSSQPELVSDHYTNATNAGLLVPLNASLLQPPTVYITNSHPHQLQVLLLVRSYSTLDPVPGGGAGLPIAKPFLLLHSNILTTSVTVVPASPSLLRVPPATLLPEKTTAVPTKSSRGTASEDDATDSNTVTRRSASLSISAKRNYLDNSTDKTSRSSKFDGASVLRSIKRRDVPGGRARKSRKVGGGTDVGPEDEASGVTLVQVNNSVPPAIPGSNNNSDPIDSVESTVRSNAKSASRSDVDGTTQSDVENTTRNNVENTTRNNVENTTRNNVKNTTRNNVKNPTRNNVKNTIRRNMKNTTRNNVENTTRSNVEKPTSSNVENTTSSNVEKTTSSNVENTTSSNEENTRSSNEENTTLSDVEITSRSTEPSVTRSNTVSTTRHAAAGDHSATSDVPETARPAAPYMAPNALATFTANATQLLYEVYLSYMYEGDVLEDHYWETVVETSSPQQLEQHATKVASFLTDDNHTAPPPYLFVSYSGVGAVVSVRVTNVYFANTSGSDVMVRVSNGSLYSSSVSYGCDFIPDEQHRCTKLVNPLTQIFCASLLFVGLVLCFAGHRWVNFTMFTAGFLGAWFTLFVTFVHVPHADIHVLALATFQYSLVCGVLWLVLWHWLKRPFVSALLIILEAGLLTAMTTTHFLKYALVPTPSNVAVFVVLPVLFALCLVVYSFRNIKAVHILSCVLVGSYAATVPLSFYFGCSLSYIAINAVAAMTVPGYTAAVGFPPFQTCDIVLLTLWLTLLTSSLAYQHVRERHSPPFPPPNLQYWRAARRACAFLHERGTACCGGLVRRASRRYSNLSTTDDRAPQNGAAAPERGPQGGTGADTQQETRFYAPCLRSNLNSVKIWITGGMGLRNRTPFPAYHSFPRHPEESEESDDREREEEIQNGTYAPPEVAPTAGVRSRTVKVWSDLKENFLQRIRPHILWRRSTLVEDCPDDAVSSGSSDGEVDRRAVGIFGDVETPVRDSDSEERRFSEASDRDLADMRGDNFRSSQLTFDHL